VGESIYVGPGQRVVDIEKGYSQREAFKHITTPGRTQGVEGDVSVDVGEGTPQIAGNNLFEEGRGHHLVQLAEIAPGDRKYIHRHPLGETVWIIYEGEGEFFPDLETAIPVKTGMLLHAYPGEWHGLRNTGDVPLRYLSIEGPMFMREGSTEFAE
jgi:mannose-6-phosphate isomerase-like protein (cupin superfamily)